MAKSTTRKTTSTAKKAATASKPAARKSAASKPAATATPAKPAAAKTVTPHPAVAQAVKAAVTSTAAPAKPAPNKDDDVLRKPDLIEKVVVRSGVKKKDAKPVIEAMLAVLGEALDAGEELRLPPLGKVMVNRTKELDNGAAHIVKVRRPKSATAAGKEPLAKAAE